MQQILGQAWFKPKAERENHHNDQAWKLGLEWKLQVAVVLERLPVVLPDKPQWQEDYDNLRTYLDQFGKEYPAELYGTMEIEDVLKNMIFEALLFDDSLAEMDGQDIMSTNGKVWRMHVFDDPNGLSLQYAAQRQSVTIHFSNAGRTEGPTNCTLLPGPGRRNILARKGLLHHVNCE